MAYMDYILCKDCGCKTVPDSYDRVRDYLEERWGDPEAEVWTLDFIRCPSCNTKLESELAALREALIPSPETKAAYWGSDEIECTDWTLIKDIMRLIRERAALAGEGE